MYSWCATRNPVPDSAYHLADLKSVTTESQNVSPCMTATPLSRVNWKMCYENSTFACFDVICTQFSVTWPHCATDCRHDLDYAQQDGSDSTCVRRVHAVQNKTPEQTSACLPAYMALQKIAGYQRFWYMCVWLSFTLEGMLLKAFGMCSEWHYTTRWLTYGNMTFRPTGSLSYVSIRQSPSLCNATLNTCPCLRAIWKVTW